MRSGSRPAFGAPRCRVREQKMFASCKLPTILSPRRMSTGRRPGLAAPHKGYQDGLLSRAPPMTRSRTPIRFAVCVVTLLFAATSPARSATVTALQSTFHDGQTFLTWDDLPGAGWIYHIYMSSSALNSPDALDNALEIGQVGDQS